MVHHDEDEIVQSVVQHIVTLSKAAYQLQCCQDSTSSFEEKTLDLTRLQTPALIDIVNSDRVLQQEIEQLEEEAITCCDSWPYGLL